MSGLDSGRIALVVAKPAGGGVSAKTAESVATGYFLTGDLVLTVRHVADRPDWVFSVRAETGGPDEGDRWAIATPQWIGTGDVDAMLLRTSRRFGDWELPSWPSATGGIWKSAGYARVAADKRNENRKTLPLDGSYDLSLGQGPQELALRTEQNIFQEWDDYWKGISGAPIFSGERDGSSGIIGIITEANRTLSNGLVGLPTARLLDDVQFRSIITHSFLGSLPAHPFCLVLTSESSTSDLVGQTADVLAGFRAEETQFQRLYELPIQIPAVEAISSPENWAATIDALARADYLIADVTSFEPVVMLLLGIRSVLRRGVTISVTGDQPATVSAALPFNIQETRALWFDDVDFYDHLHMAMAEGASNLSRDPTYLDLPAYQAVRAPRPASWAENDDKSLFVLCSFSSDYSDFYRNKIRPIIRAHTGNKTPLRMLDLRSPRLVGQAVYEHMRWSSWCLADWTEWRPNVFFELGVRLACSERDPLCIISRSDAVTKHDRLLQYDLLLRLLDPVVYDQTNPRETLKSALESWPRPPYTGNGRQPSLRALPTAATYRMAQSSFRWQHDAMLTPPHIEQRQAAELIFGKDQEKRPERLILFADNEQFDGALRAAVQEKWIAAWLYLRHLADYNVFDQENPELITIARLADYALSSSDDPRHIQLRIEISDFLIARRAGKSAGKSAAAINDLLDQLLALKASAKIARDDGNWGKAIGDLDEAIDLLRARMTESTPTLPGRLASELADVFGLLGGVEKRWGLSLAGQDRRGHLEASVTAYDEGFSYEQHLKPEEANTYNRVNRLVGRVLLNPQVLVGVGDAAPELSEDLREADEILAEEIRSARQKGPWAYCDLGTIRLLRGDPDALLIFRDLDRLRPPTFVYESTLATLQPLCEAAADLLPDLQRAVAQLRYSAQYRE